MRGGVNQELRDRDVRELVGMMSNPPAGKIFAPPDTRKPRKQPHNQDQEEQSSPTSSTRQRGKVVSDRRHGLCLRFGVQRQRTR